MEGIKIAYEYTYEKLGKEYSGDEYAEKFRGWLYQAVNGKKDYSQEEYEKIREHCKIFDKTVYNLVFRDLMPEECRNVRYIIILCRDIEDKMICNIRLLDEDILTYTVLMSTNASKYLYAKGVYISMILEDGSFIEI